MYAGRFTWPRRIAVAQLIIFGLVGAGCVVYGFWAAPPDATRLIWFGVGAGLIVLSVNFFVLAMICLKVEGTTYRMYDTLLETRESVSRLHAPLQSIAEDVQISDAAKSITHREKERTALRAAIHEEIVRGDWEAAYVLIDQMEKRYGYAAEAARFREEVEQTRQHAIAMKIDEAIERIESHCDACDWARARREAERLLRLFPDNERVRALPDEIARRREKRKQALLEAWEDARARNDVDRGIEVLKELDQYLTPEEAVSLRDAARDVFKTKLLNLGVQFGLAVSEKRWRDALEIGLQITEEFPNSRMAAEVNSKLDALRQRAGLDPDAELIEHHPADRPATP